jgi:hypothetical protein
MKSAMIWKASACRPGYGEFADRADPIHHQRIRDVLEAHPADGGRGIIQKRVALDTRSQESVIRNQESVISNQQSEKLLIPDS